LHQLPSEQGRCIRALIDDVVRVAGRPWHTRAHGGVEGAAPAPGWFSRARKLLRWELMRVGGENLWASRQSVSLTRRPSAANALPLKSCFIN
jgi:hypothetical protein